LIFCLVFHEAELYHSNEGMPSVETITEFETKTLRDVLSVLFKRKVQIILFFIVIVSTVTVGILRMKPTYEAASQILIKIGRENLYVPTAPGSARTNPIIQVNREEQINSEIEILISPYLVDQVVQSFGPKVLYPDLKEEDDSPVNARAGGPASQKLFDVAASILRQNLIAKGIEKSNVIEVRFTHPDPKIAAEVVNKLIDLYLERHIEVHKTSESVNFFKEQTQLFKEKVRQADEALESFKKAHNVRSLDQEKEILLQKEADLRSSLNETESQISETGKRLEQLGSQLAATPKTIAQGEQIEHSPYVINTLQSHLVELELKEKELLTKYTDQSRLVQSVREEIQIVKDKLARQEEKRYGSTRTGLNPSYQRLQDELFRNEVERKALAAKKETQQAQLLDFKTRLEKLNWIEVELNDLVQQVDVDRENYRLYLTKFEESRISDAMDTEKIANVVQIQPARPPLNPIEANKRRNLALGLFLGAFGALGLAFFMEYLDDSIETPEDAERVLQIPVLASIPDLR